MKTYTITEIGKYAKDYQHVGLFSPDGTKIIPFNNIKKTTCEQRFEEIKRKLHHDITPEGLYHIHCRNNFQKDQPSDIYNYVKGKLKDLPEPAQATQPVEEEPATGKGTKEHVLSYNAALKINTELAALKVQVKDLLEANKHLLKEVADLNEELDESEEDIQELAEHNAPRQMMNDGMEYLTNFFPTINKYMGQYFQNKNVENYIKLIKAQREAGLPISQPAQQMAQPGKKMKFPMTMEVPNEKGEIEEFTISNPAEYNHAISLRQQYEAHINQQHQAAPMQQGNGQAPATEEAQYVEVPNELGPMPDEVTDPHSYFAWLTKFSQIDPDGYNTFIAGQSA